jgi:hypothetical protein
MVQENNELPEKLQPKPRLKELQYMRSVNSNVCSFGTPPFASLSFLPRRTGTNRPSYSVGEKKGGQ